MKARVCVICGALGTTRWTINNGEVVSVADLCGLHSVPLNDVIEAAGLNPPAAATAPALPPVIVQRQPRRTSFEPLNWQPQVPE